VTDTDADGAVWLTDVKWLLKNNANIATSLKGNGDFRSEECLKLLKEADIVVTNPRVMCKSNQNNKFWSGGKSLSRSS